MRASVLQTSAAIGTALPRERLNVPMRPRQRSAPTLSARSALRTATHDIHERLHRHPALSRLAAGTVDRDEYRHLLARSYGFYAVVEPMLSLGGGLTDCLAGDLAELGLSADAIAALPRCAPPPIGCGYVEMIGARYVLLGASLGGKVMARALAGRASGAAALPVRFLTGVSTDDWSRFVVGLDTNLPDAAAQDRAAAAAVAMFVAYEEWMSA
jgi:heme oxygenase